MSPQRRTRHRLGQVDGWLMVLGEINYCCVLPSCCAGSCRDEEILLAFTPSAGVCVLLRSGCL